MVLMRQISREHTLTVLLPGNIGLFWLDVWISGYGELLKLEIKFGWLSVSFKDRHLFTGGS